MTFELTKLKYNYSALEPHIDALTMEIHHSKHHAAYTSKFNAELKSLSLEDKGIFELMKNISEYTPGLRNNGGGYFNHDLFWSILTPNGQKTPSGNLLESINKDFGSFEKFKLEFENAAATRFGSGWAWLVKSADGKLVVSSTANQDNPLMDIAEVKGTPVLALDVWEHAYYLKYQNKRPDYISAFWEVVDWQEVSDRFNK